MRISPDREYPGGYPDTEVERAAAEDGAAAVHDPALWGENTQPRFLDALAAGHGTGRALIGYGLRGDVQEVVTRIETGLPEAAHHEQDALDALERERETRVAQLVLRYAIAEAGLPLPSRRTLVQLAVSLLLLFVGDWAIVTVAFQVLGLSDTPWVAGASFTDDLHLAALTSVMLLVFLAHAAGDKLRRMALAHERLRTATSAEARRALPRPSVVDALVFVVAVGVAAFTLWGLSAIRVAYLATEGIPAQAVPFLALQIGVLVAAVYLSYRHAHPYAQEWADKQRATERVERLSDERQERFEHDVARVNSDIELVGTLLGQAGHHVRADRANVSRQAPLYARRVQLAQPEPSSNRLFPDELPLPAVLEDDELRRSLIGVTELTDYTKLDIASVSERRAAIRAELTGLEDRLREKQLHALLPADVELPGNAAPGDGDAGGTDEATVTGLPGGAPGSGGTTSEAA